jgi:hypothetical protein
MFVSPIHSLSKVKFGVNFNVEDIKCKLKQKNKKENIDKNINKK